MGGKALVMGYLLSDLQQERLLRRQTGAFG